MDYIGPDNFITELSPLVKKVTVLDHHKTGLELVDKLKAENKMPENGIYLLLIILQVISYMV